MSFSPAGPHPADQISFATTADVPDIVDLARTALPSMHSLHDPQRWEEFSRLGDGSTWHSTCTLVLRDRSPAHGLIGFVWVDAAARVDLGIDEPWWCINAIAIAPAYRGHGHGRDLIRVITGAAHAVGVVMLYGQSVPAAVPFWQRLGALVAADGEAVRSVGAPHHLNGEAISLNLQPGPGDRWFMIHIGAPGSARALLVPDTLYRHITGTADET